MSRIVPIAALATTTALGLFVGIWAYFAPDGFYTTFPGLLVHWVSGDGPFNEHLVRDVGALYLALSAASVVGLVWRTPHVFRVLGVAWTVFGILHLAYHLTHVARTESVADAVGSVVSIAVALLLGALLLIPVAPRAGSRS